MSRWLWHQWLQLLVSIPGFGKIVHGSSALSRSGEVSRFRFRLQVKGSNVLAPIPALANGKMFRLRWPQLRPWLRIPALNLAKSASKDHHCTGGRGQLGVRMYPVVDDCHAPAYVIFESVGDKPLQG